MDELGIPPMHEAAMILGMFAATFGVRYVSLAVASRTVLPDFIVRGLKFVPAAVLSAIVLPAVLYAGNGEVNFSGSNAYLVAGVAAGVVAYRTRNLMWTIIVGMLFFLIYRGWIT